MHTNLISVADLAALVEAGTVAVFDCRDDLMRPGWGREAYLNGHVPGAAYVDLGKDLSGPPLTDEGRHPMPSEDALVALFSRLGIAPGLQVAANFQHALEGTSAAEVVYSCGSGVTACHLALAAHWVGLPEGRVYVGSFSEWTRDAGRPVATGAEPGGL